MKLKTHQMTLEFPRDPSSCSCRKRALLQRMEAWLDDEWWGHWRHKGGPGGETNSPQGAELPGERGSSSSEGQELLE